MMKKHLAPALFSLSLCAVLGGVRTAGAQTFDGIPAAVADSAIRASIAPAAAREIGASRDPGKLAGPTMLAPTPIRLGAANVVAERAPIAPAAVIVDWKMPTSRALMIGGAATALVGLVAVQGDTGAIIALGGTAVAVYGLYLHYTR